MASRATCAGMNDHVGQHPIMEDRLPARIRDLRQCEIVVETWMLPLEGREILRELNPDHFPPFNEDPIADQRDFLFKFSNTWRIAFFRRHTFSIKKVGIRVNTPANEKM